MSLEKTANTEFKLRVKAPLHAAISAAAGDHGVSLNAEITQRLEASFRDEALLPQVLDAAFGPYVAGLLLQMGKSMSDAASHAAFAAEHSLTAVEQWINQPWAYKQAVDAARRTLAHYKPSGEPTPPPYLARMPKPIAEIALNLGVASADGAMQVVANPEADAVGPLAWARERLGKVAEDRVGLPPGASQRKGAQQC